MERLPAPEERQWLTHALKKLIAKRGVAMLDAAPLVEPTNEWFPDKWAATGTHGHRLAQRLLYYAGLRELRPTLSAYAPEWNEDGTRPWDAGTAGWFAGIREGHAHFGLHVRQFSDPEAAAGVLAHEVAHAWRTHHHLVIEDREKEELLTDLTTVVLGFGILSTNNTDRYRSSGNWSVTTWSVSAVGYLPPQAMAYLLALWSAARGKSGERKLIERHLEPNQLGFFRAALEDLAQSEKSPRQLLGIEAPAGEHASVRPRDFTPDHPSDTEIGEPEYEKSESGNRGKTVYRKAKGDTFGHVLVGAVAGFFVGAFVGLMTFGDQAIGSAMVSAAVCTIGMAVFMAYRSRRDVCSACATAVEEDVAICIGCGGTLGRRVTTRELHRIREDELDRAAARDVEYDECDLCEPERPCPAHKATERFGPAEDETEPGRRLAGSGRRLIRSYVLSGVRPSLFVSRTNMYIAVEIPWPHVPQNQYITASSELRRPDPNPSRRLRHPHHSGAPRPRRRANDHDLHPRPEQRRRAWSPEPPRDPLTARLRNPNAQSVSQSQPY